MRGFSPLHAGLYLLPMAVIGAIFAPLSGRVISSRGPRLSLVLAGVALAGGSAMLTMLTPSTSSVYLLAANLVFGIGFGLVQPPITQTAVSGMPPAQAGVAAAIASTSRQVGNTLGIAVVGAALRSAIATALGPGFTAVSHVGWWIATGFGAAVLIVGFASTTRWAQETARRTASRLGSDPVESATATGRHVAGAPSTRPDADGTGHGRLANPPMTLTS